MPVSGGQQLAAPQNDVTGTLLSQCNIADQQPLALGVASDEEVTVLEAGLGEQVLRDLFESAVALRGLLEIQGKESNPQ